MRAIINANNGRRLVVGDADERSGAHALFLNKSFGQFPAEFLIGQFPGRFEIKFVERAFDRDGADLVGIDQSLNTRRQIELGLRIHMHILQQDYRRFICARSALIYLTDRNGILRERGHDGAERRWK